VVVAVGATVQGELATEPIPLILKLVAFDATQESDAVWPLVMLAGVAVNELITGAAGADPGAIDMFTISEPVPPAFVAVAVIVAVPAAVGVPESSPLVLIDKPAGTPVALNVGELVAANCCENGTPTVADAEIMNTGGGVVTWAFTT
jgi:hypothetical protein